MHERSFVCKPTLDLRPTFSGLWVPLLHCPEAETNCKVFYRSSPGHALAKSCEGINVWKIKSSGK
jgi:hypothetical protein